MSNGTISGFPVGSELQINLGDGPKWYALMHKFVTTGGGWVREIYADGSLDNRREGIRVVSGPTMVLSSRAVPVKAKKNTKRGRDPLHR